MMDDNRSVAVITGENSKSVGRSRLHSPGISAQALRDYFSHQSATSRYATRLTFKRIAADLGILTESGRIEDVEWGTITAADFTYLIDLWRERDKIHSTSIRRYLSALRGLAGVCFLNKSMDGDTYARIKMVKFPRGANIGGRGMCVERAYQKALLDNCVNDNRIQGVRDAAMLAILFGTGIRREEAISLTQADIDFVSCEIRVKVKGGNSVSRFLSAWAIPYIKNWLECKALHGKGGGHILVGINKSGVISSKKLNGRSVLRLLEERSIKAGLPVLVRPHDARRTMGTEMIKEHGELIAQKVLGHASLDTTRIYDKRGDDVLRKIMSERK